jgi:hypothetical protein
MKLEKKKSLFLLTLSVMNGNYSKCPWLEKVTSLKFHQAALLLTNLDFSELLQAVLTFFITTKSLFLAKKIYLFSEFLIFQKSHARKKT